MVQLTCIWTVPAYFLGAIRHVFQGWVVFGGRLEGHLLPGPAQLTRVCGHEHHRCSSYWQRNSSESLRVNLSLSQEP